MIRADDVRPIRICTRHCSDFSKEFDDDDDDDDYGYDEVITFHCTNTRSLAGAFDGRLHSMVHRRS